MDRRIREVLVPQGDISCSHSCHRAMLETITMNERGTTSFSKSGSSTLRVNSINADSDNRWPGGDAHEDLVNENLAKVVIQYRPVSGGAGITANDDPETHRDDRHRNNILVRNSRIDGCPCASHSHNDFTKLLSGFNDAVYAVRVTTFCNTHYACSSPPVHTSLY